MGKSTDPPAPSPVTCCYCLNIYTSLPMKNVKAHFPMKRLYGLHHSFGNRRGKICKDFWASFLTCLINTLWFLQSPVVCYNYSICGLPMKDSSLKQYPDSKNISIPRDGIDINGSPDQTKACFCLLPRLPASETYTLLSPVWGHSLYLLVFRGYLQFFLQISTFHTVTLKNFAGKHSLQPHQLF